MSESKPTAGIYKMRKKGLTVELRLFHLAVTLLNRHLARRGREVGRSEKKQTLMREM